MCKSITVEFFRKAHVYIKAKGGSRATEPQACITMLEARPFFSQLQEQLAPQAIESVYRFYIDKETDPQEIIENEPLTEVVVQILKLMQHMTEFQDYFGLFSKVAKPFFLDVILTNFIMLESHRANFVENEQEFCEEFYDVCFTQVASSSTGVLINPESYVDAADGGPHPADRWFQWVQLQRADSSHRCIPEQCRPRQPGYYLS